MIPSEIIIYNQKLNKVEQLTKADLKKYRKLELYITEVEAISLAEKLLSKGQLAFPLDRNWYDAQRDENLENNGDTANVAGRKKFSLGAKALYTLASRLAAKKNPEYKLLFRLKDKANETLQFSVEIALETNPSVVVGEVYIVRDRTFCQLSTNQNTLLPAEKFCPFMDQTTLNELMLMLANNPCQAVVVVAYYGTKRCANKLERTILDFAKAVALVLLVLREELWGREVITEEAINFPSPQEKAALSYEEELQEKTLNHEKLTKNKGLTPKLETIASQDYLGVYAKRLRECLGNNKVVLVGGNDNWRKKMASVFENPMVIEGKNFEPAKLQEAVLVIINTNEVGHAVTKKASGLAANDRIRYLYTGKYNIEAIAQDILSMIGK